MQKRLLTPFFEQEYYQRSIELSLLNIGEINKMKKILYGMAGIGIVFIFLVLFCIIFNCIVYKNINNIEGVVRYKQRALSFFILF